MFHLLSNALRISGAGVLLSLASLGVILAGTAFQIAVRWLLSI